MPIRNAVLAVLLCSVPVIASAAADGPADAAAEQASTEYRDEVAARLAARGDAESAMAAVLLLGVDADAVFHGPSPVARELIAGIDVEHAPPVVLQRLLGNRLLTLERRQAAVARLLDVDRRNADGWIYAIDLAVERGASDDEIDRLIADAAASVGIYSTRMDATIRTLFRGLTAVPMPDALRASVAADMPSPDTGADVADRYGAVLAMGLGMAIAQPSALRTQCDRTRILHWQRRAAACIALARTMALNAETLFEEMGALATWRAAVGDDPDLRRAFRTSSARINALRTLGDAMPGHDVETREFIARMARNDGTEIANIEAMLREAGIEPESER